LEGGEVKPRLLIINHPNAECPLRRDILTGIQEFFLDGNR